MKDIKSSAVSSAWVFLFFTLCCGGLAYFNWDDKAMRIEMLLFTFISIMLSLFVCRTFYLTSQGIRHNFFGYCYKTTKWSDIKNVSRVNMVRRGIQLWVTCNGADVLQPDQCGMLPDSTKISIKWLRGDYFTLLNAPEIVECIEKYYGRLDYDYLAHK